MPGPWIIIIQNYMRIKTNNTGPSKLKRLLVIGSINIDLSLKTSRIPYPGESFLGRNYNWIPGGKGANQAICASRLGAETVFIGCVGEDQHGKLLIKNLVKNAIRTDFIQYSKKESTGLAVIMVDDSGENRILVFPGANMDLSPDSIDFAFRGGEKPDGVLINFEINKKVIEYSVQRALEDKIPVFIDAGPARSDLDMAKLCGVTVISPNLTELAAMLSTLGWKGNLTESEEMKKGGERLLQELDASYILIKLGSKGALGIGQGDSLFVPAFAVEAVDTTAAGDAFTAAFTVNFLQYGNFRESVVYGCAAGAIATTKEGAEPSMPKASDVSTFLDFKMQ